MWWISFRETGDFADIPHLFHFLELLMVFFAKNPDPDKVSHITFPQWEGNSWKGKNNQTYNEWILKRMYPSVIFRDRDNTDDMTIIDRGQLNNGNINKSWCKYIRRFDPYLWSRTLKIPYNISKLPIVTYINRQNAKNRRMPDIIHANFVKEMLQIPDIEFINVIMEDLPFDKQFEIANKTDLLIGVHGNGLSHAAFMHPHRNVVEIYPTGWSFQWDYYTLSKMMGHEYTCIFNNNICMPQMFVKAMGAQCTHFTRVPVEPISAIIDQIKEEK